MEILRIDETTAEHVAPLVAAFRVTLRGYKGIASEPDVEGGREEILDFLRSGYPVFAVVDAGEYIGYAVCRVEGPVIWVEHIYVHEDHRRRGVASLLFDKAEALASSMGGDTVYNYVHPNNDGMIGFLRSKGYTVLNLIEIRKPYDGEKLNEKIDVNGHLFDY